MATTTVRKRERGECVVVVLEGTKSSKDEKGIAPLTWAWHNIVNKGDQLLVVNILNPPVGSNSNQLSICCLGDSSASPCQGQAYMRLLYQQIGQRKEMFLRILRPFYEKCKTSGVKFEAKVAAGYRPKTLVFEEAKNAKATWVVMDRCLADEDCLRLHRENWNVALVNEDEEAEVYNLSPIKTQVVPVEAREKPNAELPELHLELPVLQDGSQIPSSPGEQLHLLGSTSNSTPTVLADQALETISNVGENSCRGQNFETEIGVKLPMELSWEQILGITEGLQAWPCICGDFDVYRGFLRDPPGMNVMVKRFAGDTDEIIEAEKRVAWFMSHKNILGAMAYQASSGGSALVYQYSGKGTLEQFLNHARGRPEGLTCPERMKVAVEIARGIRYMHEECPGGPVVHGDVRPCNIFLERDYQPLISGFGRTRWLKMEQMVMEDTYYRCWYEATSDSESIDLVKSDVFDFGVLLLRLFCLTPMPENDYELVHWARPLLLQGAFHELIDQEMEELDMYEMYRVMSVATQCTKTKPLSRPTMTQVLSFLRGENSCAVLSSPSSDCSLGKETNQFF